MELDKYKNWDVYHLVPPYFFSPYHFYKRKIKALRSSNLNANILTFITYKMYEENKIKYKDIEKKRLVRFVLIRSRVFLSANILFFIIKELLKGRKIVLHALRVDEASILVLIKYLPFLNKRLIIIQEFEGDRVSEFLYSKGVKSFHNKEVSKLRVKNRILYYVYFFIEKLQIKFSDALVLMSKEHIDLCDDRGGIKKEKFVLPTLPERSRVYFDTEARREVREKLGLLNKKVFIYVGNIKGKWQRLDAMCQFVSDCYKENNNIVFIFLVRIDDISLAKETVRNYGIENITFIRNEPSSEVYKYLSAADIALYLRHNHLMNSIVTSGKLGEYISTGLSVISTGANASVLNDYMLDNKLLISVNDDLIVTDELMKSICKDEEYSKINRKNLESEFYLRFNMDRILCENYPNFVKNIIDKV